MKLVSFLNKLLKDDGFILIDANSKKYIIGNPKKEKPIILKLLDKKLHYKLLLYPDLYVGEAYTDGTLVIENGSLTDFLEITMKNIGRNEINIFGQIIKKIRGSYRYLTSFNLIKKSKDPNEAKSKLLAKKWKSSLINNLLKKAGSIDTRPDDIHEEVHGKELLIVLQYTYSPTYSTYSTRVVLLVVTIY